MMEVGLDMAGQETKTIDGFDLDSFDLVVPLSKEAERYLPALADSSRHIRRAMKDPMGVKGQPEEVRQAFRTGRDHIKGIVQAIVDGEIVAGS